jgi:nitrite reductase/ring-hydroxylating ferredoxin subunit
MFRSASAHAGPRSCQLVAEGGSGRPASASERVYATPSSVALGPLALIGPGAARSFVVQLPGGRFHGFVVRRGDEVFGYVDRCPHMGMPLARALDAYLAPSGGLIACGWHGALFDIESGACVGGPCPGARLSPWPVAVVDGVIVTRDAA